MKFDDLILELYTHSKWDDVINAMIGEEDPQVVQDVLATKENFWKAYHIAKQMTDFTLDEWNAYQAEVIHGHIDDYIPLTPKQIADDFVRYITDIHKPERDYSQKDFSDFGI